jgi:acyl carrier protein
MQATADLSLRIRELVSSQLGVEMEDVRPESDLLDDLGADSLDVVELVMLLEDAFDIEVPDHDVEALRRIGELERYVAKRVAF